METTAPRIAPSHPLDGGRLTLAEARRDGDALGGVAQILDATGDLLHAAEVTVTDPRSIAAFLCGIPAPFRAQGGVIAFAMTTWGMDPDATLAGDAEPPEIAPPPATYDPDLADGNPRKLRQLLEQANRDIVFLGDTLRAERAETARLAEALRRADEECARAIARTTELETENAALEASITHPDQAAGVGALDLVEAAQRAYAAGDVLTIDGRDFARAPYAPAARRRAAKTLARGAKAIVGLTAAEDIPATPIAFGRGQAYAAFTRQERIETPTFKGDVPILYLHIPPDARDQRGKAVLGILPRSPGEKRHGGRRTIPVPPEVAAQPHPVRRERKHVATWFDAFTGDRLAEQTERLGIDHWTAQGEQRTFEEIQREREALGYDPGRVPPYRPTVQTPLRVVRPEPRQDADSLPKGVCRQDAEVFGALFDPPPGTCPDCGERATIGGRCARHFEGHLQRHKETYPLVQVGAG